MFFIQNNTMSPLPWTVVDQQNGVIVDREGYLVAVIPIAYPQLTVDSTSVMPGILRDSNIKPMLSDEYQAANLRLISCAPELLSALKEAAYHLDAAGIPLKQSYYDLINRASSGVLPIAPRNTND
jgi:hypothetical protein